MIVLLAVAIYVAAVVFGKLQTAFSEEDTPEMGSIDMGEANPSDD